MRVTAFVVFNLFASAHALIAAPPEADPVTVNWRAESGVPLRVYLTARLPKRLGAPVHARLIEPVFSFDREIIPAGSEVTGLVTKLSPVSKFQRFSALLGGDFTPLHRAEVEFNSVTLADGKQISFHTVAASGLNSIYSPKAKPAAAVGASGGTLQKAKAAITDQLRARTGSVSDMVRAPDKMERLEDYFLMKLPYHPQWVRKGTRFDASLRDSVDFGSGTIDRNGLGELGTQPSNDSVVHARFSTGVSSGDAKLGDKVAATVSQPLFSTDNHLILPEGTRLTGTVTSVRAARWFHRGGQLRFAFDRVDLPEGSPHPTAESRPAVAQIHAVLDSAEAGGAAKIEVDAEGNAKAVESKTRLILPAISVLIATRGGDRDGDRENSTAANAANSTNSRRHVLGGGLGFGLLGMIAARTSSVTGVALGYYGMAWSVYRNILARGADVEFGKDAAMDIRFGSRAPVTPPR